MTTRKRLRDVRDEEEGEDGLLPLKVMEYSVMFLFVYAHVCGKE